MNRANFFKVIGGGCAAVLGFNPVPKAWTMAPIKVIDLKFKRELVWEEVIRVHLVKKVDGKMLTKCWECLDDDGLIQCLNQIHKDNNGEAIDIDIQYLEMPFFVDEEGVSERYYLPEKSNELPKGIKI